MISPTGPRVRLSRSALVAGASRAIEAGGADAVADLRRDAYGHGVQFVAETLVQVGIRAAVLDPESVEVAQRVGIATVADAPTLDPAIVFGFPGASTAVDDDAAGIRRPVMSLVGSVLSIKALRAGEGVSYNYTHIASQDTRIALVSGGFGQGVARSLGNHASVEIRGEVYPIVGRVAMDVCVIDVGEADIARGDEVIYFGGQGPARSALAAWEAASGLTAAELVCALGLRLPREVVA
ncbi:alanine racemase C-terminal domain-containing protein [Microbacterium schleiferi]|uniref:alanine racemase C-terminal domain-containing protein n=1 Tax=Microbacterium schleiferi TaxID=69362 RepID=UPI00311ED2ED